MTITIKCEDCGSEIDCEPIIIDTIYPSFLKSLSHRINHHRCDKRDSWKTMNINELFEKMFEHYIKLIDSKKELNKTRMLDHLSDIGNYCGFIYSRLVEDQE